MRYTPLKQKGRHGEVMDVIRRKVWPRVLGRAHRRCEGCGASDRTLHWSHVFGRRGTGGGLGEWADIADLTAALCASPGGDPGCHDKLDRHLDDLLAFRISWDAIHRLAKTCDIDLATHGVNPSTFSVMEAIRYAIRRAEQDGWSIDPETITPVMV